MHQSLSTIPGPIGVFDSGYGGLTILDKIREAMRVPRMAHVRLRWCMSSRNRL